MDFVTTMIKISLKKLPVEGKAFFLVQNSWQKYRVIIYTPYNMGHIFLINILDMFIDLFVISKSWLGVLPTNFIECSIFNLILMKNNLSTFT